VFWYIAIGVFNAALYIALGAALEALGFSVFLAGVLAFLPCVTLSYIGHKTKTFRSSGRHLHEAPRFLATALIGLALSAVAPQVVVNLGLPPVVGFVFTSLAVPVVNLIAMRFWVFANPGAEPPTVSAEQS